MARTTKKSKTMESKTKKSKTKKSKTMKSKSTKSILRVKSASDIKKMERSLGNGTINFVLIYADWCGACHRFKKNIWNPMCKGPAKHNRIEISNDMLQNSSLRNAKFEYLPSLIVVDEAGNVQSFKTPEGKDTNAMPTPKTLADMKRIVNVPVNSLNLVKAPAPVLNESPQRTQQSLPPQRTQQSLPPQRTHPKTAVNIPNIPLPPEPSFKQENSNVLTIETTANLAKNTQDKSSIPAGNVYTPTPMVAPQAEKTRPTSMKTRRRIRR